jgi:hypothetical protein
MTIRQVRCTHGHRSYSQDRTGFGYGPLDVLAEEWVATESLAVARATGPAIGDVVDDRVEAGTHLRLDASDYIYIGPEFGGYGWHRFAVLDGPLAGECVLVMIGPEPAAPPPQLQPVRG